jgi:hypothetical protein
MEGMKALFVRRCLWAFLALVLALGCGRGLPSPASADKGEEAIRTALEAWKQGETPEALQRRSPPLWVNEPEWTAGNRLLAYDLADKVEPFGRQLRCTVKLALQDKGGKTYEKRIGYQIDTNPNLVIVREGLGG